jgi:hypothetical protein
LPHLERKEGRKEGRKKERKKEKGSMEENYTEEQ